MSRGKTAPPYTVRLPLLFVDPDVQGARRLAEYLHAQYEPGVVATAQQAYAIAQAWHPAFVVLELDLPDVPGLELVAALQRAPETRTIMLVVLTHRRAIADKIAAFQAGADDFLVKPVLPEQFEMHLSLLRGFLRTAGLRTVGTGSPTGGPRGTGSPTGGPRGTGSERRS
jgi:DNA-binding response OmpR family regulator